MDKALPSNQEQEYEVIGILLECFDYDFLIENIPKLRDESFYFPETKKAFDYIKVKVYEEKVCPDFSSAPIDLSGFLECGLKHQLPSLTQSLRKLEMKREMIKHANKTLDAAYSEDYPSISEMLGFINHETNRIVNEHQQLKEVSTRETIKKAMQMVVESATAHENKSFVPYKHPVLDEVITLYRKQINALGAFQGDGKTALALECFKNQALNGMNVVYFCTESSADELILRMNGNHVGMSMQKMLNGDMTQPELDKFQRGFLDFNNQNRNFWIYGLGDFELRIDDISSIVSKMTRETGRLDMVYLDFLQDLGAPMGQRLDERQTIGYNVKQFKDICVRNDCAGTMLCQFNQETHREKWPTKRSFRGSGVIADASHVMSVLYTDQPDNEQRPDLLEMVLYSVKTRLVKRFCKKIMFNGAFGRFTRPTMEQQYGYAPDYDKQIK